MMSVCSLCLDEVLVAFRCATSTCVYNLCGSCVKVAFEDPTGANCGKCPMCKAPTAMHMVEALCGKGAVREVQRVLRSKVEFDVQQEQLTKKSASKELKDVHDRARKLFNDLAERVLLKCPKCKAAFTDYEGCNALTCGIENCKASFCAICLQDCGADAHGHVRQVHGDLFDKAAFNVACIVRTKKVVDTFLLGLPDEPYELKQLIRNHIERAGLTKTNSSEGIGSYLSNSFIMETRASLNEAVKNDRLSLLSDPEGDEFSTRGLRSSDISPRQAVPVDYQFQLIPNMKGVYDITVRRVDDSISGWTLIPLDDLGIDNINRPKVDCLVNIKQSLRCAVVAFEGAKELYQTRSVQPAKGVSLGDNEIAVEFLRVAPDGNVPSITAMHRQNFRDVIGINQNLRMSLLQMHVESVTERELMFEPLNHLVGNGTPLPILSEIATPVPSTFYNLNAQQQRVAHPYALRTAMEVAGPPGTGKTKTITELVRCLLSCTDFEIFVLSERNGAIDAIAEKFAEACIKQSGGKVEGITDVLMWLGIVAYGASSTIGESTKLFTPQEKIRYHPELLELRRKESERIGECKALAVRLRHSLSDYIEGLDGRLPVNTNALRRGNLIRRNQESGLTHPWEIVSAILSARADIESLVLKWVSFTVDEKMVDELVKKHSALLEDLVPSGSEHERDARIWKGEARSSLQQIALCFKTLLSNPLFSVEDADEAQSRVRHAADAITNAEVRLKGELLTKARLHLSTIGSSHNIQTCNEIAVAFESLSLDDDLEYNSDESDVETKRKTIFIFDESGCIPAYELLGLSRLGRTIEGLVLVGDKHQLPPFAAVQSHQGMPGQNRRNFGSFGDRNRLLTTTRKPSPKVKSLLDVSTLTTDNAKIKLTSQYRVPRDIANLLNDCVYQGDYSTAPDCSVPERGFRFIDVPLDEGRGAKKYTNQNEIEVTIRLVQQCSREGYDNIMILTPYKKQQRELQFKLMRQQLKQCQVLTIDQCQGQEADIVILSLVQKPTRFLSKNRFNVALSRVRTRLYLLADKAEFLDATRNSSWDCSSLARALLTIDIQGGVL